MNAMRVSMADSMMRSAAAGMAADQHMVNHSQGGHQQGSPDAAIRIQQQAEAILRSQAEALRLVSQAAAVAASSNGSNNNNNPNNNQFNGGQNNQGSGGGGGSNSGNPNQPGNHQPPNQNNQQQGSSNNYPPTSSHTGGGGGGNQHIVGQMQSQVSPELTEALRLHEQRLEQALRLQGTDPRNLGFPLTSQAQHPAHNP